MDAMEHVIEVTDETFDQVVVEGSKTAPVVVDLWADWCGPCRTLGPMLEKAATERAGAFTLAKIDVDAQGVGNALLQAVRSQSIPTVVAFRDGQPVSMFIGAYPVRRDRPVPRFDPADRRGDRGEGGRRRARQPATSPRPSKGSVTRWRRSRTTARRPSGSRGSCWSVARSTRRVR